MPRVISSPVWDPVVEGEAEALELLVEGEAEVVGEAVADRLAAIVVGEGEDPAQDRGAEQQERRVVERPPRRLGRRRAVVEQPERAVHRIADQAGNRELEGRRGQGGPAAPPRSRRGSAARS